MGTYNPRHAAQIDVVLEDFKGGTATSTDDLRSWTVNPRHARLERNDIHTADRLTLQVDWTVFPFDPRMIRAGIVTYYLQDVPDGTLALNAKTVRFIGTLDVPESSLGEDDLMVTLECRDYTALFLAVKATPAMAVALDRSLRDVVTDLMAFLPGGIPRELTLDTSALDGDGPTITGGRAGAKLPVAPADTLWSLIRDVVDRTGLVVEVRLDRLIVRPSHQPTADSPSIPFAFGRNLMTLRSKKNLTNLTKPVTMIAYDPATRGTLSATYPTAASVAAARPRTARPATTGGTHRVTSVHRRAGGRATVEHNVGEAEAFTLRGNYTPAALAALAERTYKLRAVTELEGSFTTHEMAEGGADLTLLATNDLLTVSIDEQTRALADGRRGAALASYLAAQGYPREVARALADGWDALAAIDRRMVVRKATHELGSDGYQLDVDFQNVITPVLQREVGADDVTPRSPPR